MDQNCTTCSLKLRVQICVDIMNQLVTSYVLVWLIMVWHVTCIWRTRLSVAKDGRRLIQQHEDLLLLQ